MPPHGEVVKHDCITKSGLIVRKSGVLNRREGDLRQTLFCLLEQLESHDNLVTCHIWSKKRKQSYDVIKRLPCSKYRIRSYRGMKR